MFIYNMTVSQFTKDIIDRLIIEIKKKENMCKIEQNLIEPLILYTFKRIYPYLLIISIIFVLTFLFALLILLLLVKQIKQSIN